jgi:hypothetical protein
LWRSADKGIRLDAIHADPREKKLLSNGSYHACISAEIHFATFYLFKILHQNLCDMAVSATTRGSIQDHLVIEKLSGGIGERPELLAIVETFRV